VVDVANGVGEALSGVYSPKSFPQKRFEFLPYNDSSIRSVYHIRHIDKTMLNSMPSGSDDISISRKILHEKYEQNNNDTNPSKNINKNHQIFNIEKRKCQCKQTAD
jgi:hypothetical protein